MIKILAGRCSRALRLGISRNDGFLALYNGGAGGAKDSIHSPLYPFTFSSVQFSKLTFEISPMHFSTLNVARLIAQCALLLSQFQFTNTSTLRQRDAGGLTFELKKNPTTSRRQVQGSSALTLGHGAANLEYTMPITLGGVNLEVVADLGSTDLIVAANIEESSSTGVPINVSFAIGGGSGVINEVSLVVGDFQIKEQAFVSLESEEELPFPPGVSGVFGLGPRFASNILSLLNLSSTAEPAVDQILSSGSSGVGNLITLLLSRTLNLTESDFTSGGGFLTIGSIIESDEDITTQPKIPLFLIEEEGVGIQEHWEVLMDANGIIGPDGQPIPTTSLFNDTPTTNQLKTVFDSGFALPPVPENVASAIYGRVPGSVLNQTDGYWMIPCSYELNISFSFGGVKYPIHPLDLSLPFDPNGDALADDMCIGTFMPSSASSFEKLGELDIILGMPFLRNTYFLGNFGNLTSSQIGSTEAPYVQLLSTTDMTTAHKEFVEVRLGGIDSTGTQPALLSASGSSTQNSTGSSSGGNGSSNKGGSSTKSGGDKTLRYCKSFIIFMVVVGAVSVLAI
ncbi:acid protease [Schizopora paradoxa]|uniref:Acid protease n=1 Tax=Schizopora paradoxa TaxID=27342 RepID=A0A0H2RWQ2_9AGAM|nr:acid protease [Schizopora paradoxa]